MQKTAQVPGEWVEQADPAAAPVPEAAPAADPLDDIVTAVWANPYLNDKIRSFLDYSGPEQLANQLRQILNRPEADIGYTGNERANWDMSALAYKLAESDPGPIQPPQAPEPAPATTPEQTTAPEQAPAESAPEAAPEVTQLPSRLGDYQIKNIVNESIPQAEQAKAQGATQAVMDFSTGKVQFANTVQDAYAIQNTMGPENARTTIDNFISGDFLSDLGIS
jgi:hypothetical protein